MKSYTTKEKNALFTDHTDSTTPVINVNAFNGCNNYKSRDHTQTTLVARQQVNKIYQML